MRRFLGVCLITILVLSALTGSWAETASESYDFTPEIANILNLNWLSSGTNRAMLALALGIQAADQRVLNRADVLMAFIQNPTFVGKVKNETNLMAATATEDDMIFIYFSPKLKRATAMTLEVSGGAQNDGILLETFLSSTCSEYYKIDESDMSNAVSFISSYLD